MIYGQPGNWRFTSVGSNLTDGSWHHLTITISSGVIQIKIDRHSKSLVAPSVSNIGHQLYFGKISTNFSHLSNALSGSVFTGCIRQLFFNNLSIALDSGHSLGLNSLPKPGCAVDQTCSSGTCGYRGSCRTTWDGKECQCSAGYQGERCENGKNALPLPVLRTILKNSFR